MRILTAKQIKAVETRAFESDSTEAELMLKAGTTCFEKICKIFGESLTNSRVGVFCGNGKNAGDGFVIADLLKKINVFTDIILCDKEPTVDEPKMYYQKAINNGVKVINFTKLGVENYDIIVDCIFGTGFKGVARGIAGDIIDKINDSNKTVISVDINSGLNGDTGFGEKVVKSDLTVSIGYLKTGLLINDADKYIGSLKNCNIDIELIDDYYTLVDNFSNAENVVEFNNFNSFAEEYNIIEYTNPLEVVTEIAKENDINILIKNLGKYSFLVTDKVKELSRC